MGSKVLGRQFGNRYGIFLQSGRNLIHGCGVYPSSAVTAAIEVGGTNP